VTLAFAAIPTELSDGRFPAPAWAILALGVAVIAGAAIYLAVRLRKRGDQDNR
jgi:hypothetical protein